MVAFNERWGDYDAAVVVQEASAAMPCRFSGYGSE